jgi:hypothetical protein
MTIGGLAAARCASPPARASITATGRRCRSWVNGCGPVRSCSCSVRPFSPCVCPRLCWLARHRRFLRPSLSRSLAAAPCRPGKCLLGIPSAVFPATRDVRDRRAVVVAGAGDAGSLRARLAATAKQQTSPSSILYPPPHFLAGGGGVFLSPLVERAGLPPASRADGGLSTHFISERSFLLSLRTRSRSCHSRRSTSPSPLA